jgi:predicted nuclease of restriction endonuclease-like (RecB) superfamily
MPRQPRTKQLAKTKTTTNYGSLLSRMVGLLEAARGAAARAVNSTMTSAYWEMGRQIVEYEQGGSGRAQYGEQLLDNLARDLTAKLGRGFGRENLRLMGLFYLNHQPDRISRTLSGKSDLPTLAARFPLPWSHYVTLLSVKSEQARQFYEAEALRGGWSIRQLRRQTNTQFYERTLLSRNKAAMLAKGAAPKPEDRVTPEEEIKDPLVLEFLGLKDEYSEHELEEALIRHVENFLLELRHDFTFVGRQRRLRIGDQWFRVDLLLYHRRLRCLMILDFKLDEFTHADVGQMNLYLNYAREHWTHADENPPVGLILCAERNDAVARYALGGPANKVLAAEYHTLLPDERLLAAEVERTHRLLTGRAADEAEIKPEGAQALAAKAGK